MVTRGVQSPPGRCPTESGGQFDSVSSARPADAADGESSVGEEGGEQAPGESVIEVSDEPGLRRRRECLLAERRENEDLAGGEVSVELIRFFDIGTYD